MVPELGICQVSERAWASYKEMVEYGKELKIRWM
jgi:hypothetical protein